MRSLRSILALIALAMCAAACATRPTANINAFALRSSANSFEMFRRGVDSAALVLPVVQDHQTSQAACGANALASVINYWRGSGAVSGATLFRTDPPTDPRGYSLEELLQLARRYGLTASAVRLSPADVIRELEKGRPVLVPIQAPAVYLDRYGIPGGNWPLIGLAPDFIAARAGQIEEWTQLGLVSHYVVLVGYEKDLFILVEPVLGFRTISFDRLKRYRRPFGDAALVLSGTGPPRSVLADAAPAGAQN